MLLTDCVRTPLLWSVTVSDVLPFLDDLHTWKPFAHGGTGCSWLPRKQKRLTTQLTQRRTDFFQLNLPNLPAKPTILRKDILALRFRPREMRGS